MLGWFFFGTPSVYSLFIPYALIMFGQPTLEANAICLALDYHDNKSTTSAVINFITLGVCMAFSMGASALGTSSPIYMPLLFLVLAIFLIYLYRGLKKSYDQKPS